MEPSAPGSREPAPLVVTDGVLDPIPLDEAVHRVRTYCTTLSSGWLQYDLAAIIARRSGHFATVSPWHLLLATLMNGQPTMEDVGAFDFARRTDFASLLAAVPSDLPLARMTDQQRRAVVGLCEFGFPGAWAPKITKVAALFRPHSVPILDGHVARVFGLGRAGFSEPARRGDDRRLQRIGHAISGIADTLQQNEAWFWSLRRRLIDLPGVARISDVRLLDILLWTTWDDRHEDRPRKGEHILWSEREVGEAIPIEAMRPVTIPRPRPWARQLRPDHRWPV